MVIYCVEKEMFAADCLGVAYLKMPRIILDQLESSSAPIRQQALLHLVLFASCAYSDTLVKFLGRTVHCEKGDYVGTQVGLARIIGIHPSTVYRLLHRMVDLGLICMTRVPGGCKIHLYGYGEFTAPEVVVAKAADKDPDSLGQELDDAKDRLGGRRMNYENPEY